MVDVVPPRDLLEQLQADIRSLQEQVAALGRANPLDYGTISGGGGLVIEGAGGLTIRDGGGIVVDDDGTLDVDGDATFGGNLAVVGTLSLPAGIIDNDALANPVMFGRASGFQSGFATTTSPQPYGLELIPVPAGFSQAIVTCTAYGGAYNGSGAFDYLYVKARIGDVDAGEVPVSVDNGQFRGSHAVKVRLLTGLDGGNIPVAAVVHSQNASWAAVSSRVYVEATAIFIR